MSRRFFVALAGLVTVLSPGAVYAFSLLSQPLAAGFGWRPDQVSWAFALFSLFIAIGGWFGGTVCSKQSPGRAALYGAVLLSVGYALCGTIFLTPQLPQLLLLYLYYGVIAGTGAGMVYIAAITAIMHWSKTRRGLAGGFVMMGFGLGTFFYGFIVKSWGAFASIQSSTKTYMDAYVNAASTHRLFNYDHVLLPSDDLHNLSLIFAFSGVAFLVLTALSSRFLFVPAEAEESALPSDFTQNEMFADARFYVLWAILFLNVFGGSMVIGSATSIMAELTGMTVAQSAVLYSSLAIANGLGRIAMGALSDVIGRRYTFVAIFTMQAISFIMLDTLHDVVSVCVAMGLLLFSYGGGFGTVPAAISDIFGTKDFGVNYGATISAWGLAAVLGAYFVNVLRAAGGQYVAMMQPLSVLVLVALFFPMIIDARKKAKATPVAPAIAA